MQIANANDILAKIEDCIRGGGVNAKVIKILFSSYNYIITSVFRILFFNLQKITIKELMFGEGGGGLKGHFYTDTFLLL